MPHHMALIFAYFWPESGRILKPRFRARNQTQILASSNKSKQNQNHGPNSVPGIWAPKRAWIPAQENRRGRPHPSQKSGRLLLHVRPANLTPRTALLMLAGSPSLLAVARVHMQAFFSTAGRFLECCKGIRIFDTQHCSTGTHGNGTPSPKTSPIFRVQFGDRFFVHLLSCIHTRPWV